jgi:hypothetical protein
MIQIDFINFRYFNIGPRLATNPVETANRQARLQHVEFAACDRYGPSLARSAERYHDPVGSEPRATAFTAAAAQTRSNIDAPVAIIDGAGGVTVNSATDELDPAETAARHQDGYSPGKQRGKMHGEVGGV